MGMLTFWLFRGSFNTFVVLRTKLVAQATATVDINKKYCSSYPIISVFVNDLITWKYQRPAECGFYQSVTSLWSSAEQEGVQQERNVNKTKTFITDICGRTATSKWFNWTGHPFGRNAVLVLLKTFLA